MVGRGDPLGGAGRAQFQKEASAAAGKIAEVLPRHYRVHGGGSTGTKGIGNNFGGKVGQLRIVVHSVVALVVAVVHSGSVGGGNTAGNLPDESLHLFPGCMREGPH